MFGWPGQSPISAWSPESIAPSLAAAALGGTKLAMSLSDLWWQNQLGGSFPLSVPTVEELPPAMDLDGDPPGLSGFAAELLNDAIDPLTSAVAGGVSVPLRVLWGNVASAVNSAANLIAGHRPRRGPDALALAQMVFSDARLRTEPVAPGPRFRRRSCCLIYRVSGDRKAVCGDCVLNRIEERASGQGASVRESR